MTLLDQGLVLTLCPLELIRLRGPGPLPNLIEEYIARRCGYRDREEVPTLYKITMTPKPGFGCADADRVSAPLARVA